MSGGEALTDRNGVPYVGFKVVVDAARATPASIARFQGTRRARQHLMAANHHCPAGTRYVLSSRDLYDMKKPPVFEPPAAASEPEPARFRGTTDQIVRAFHNSASCAAPVSAPLANSPWHAPQPSARAPGSPMTAGM